MNWRESLRNAIRQGSHAKGAKAPSATDDPDLLHLLHTFFPESKNEGASNEGSGGVTAERAPHRREVAEPLEAVLKGRAVELWSDRAGCLFIVADEEDARRLWEPRGTVYTADELRRVVQIGDPAIVVEIHEWKSRFDARLREYQERKGGA
jgi:hypothetical protein